MIAMIEKIDNEERNWEDEPSEAECISLFVEWRDPNKIDLKFKVALKIDFKFKVALNCSRFALDLPSTTPIPPSP